MNTDEQFYDARSADALAAVDQGDMDAAATVVGQVLLEEGTDGLVALTEAVKRARP
ncbi:hypothetical protein ACFVWX_13440 [Streptomyces sp. NPDC058220]|uniref:hypothetical protein n=1 Tax=unclassified Streptomyces TaxID=2593676 RepID=UPI003647CEAB